MIEASVSRLDEQKRRILENASLQKQAQLDDASAKSDEWLKEETAKLDAELDLIVKQAEKQADEERGLCLRAAKLAESREMLKLQNKLMDEALCRLESRFSDLSQRDDYVRILCGMALEAAEQINENKLSVVLSKNDAKLADKLSALLKKAGTDTVFSVIYTDDAPEGGITLLSEDGKRRICFDWKNAAASMTDTLVQHLLANVQS
ncbi:MAG: V-type ATP synthase subunit E family protein [Synergistaceae bacterium]|nr:V-type ATP synthase subunit E family protein [Synergistaceae bacterium]